MLTKKSWDILKKKQKVTLYLPAVRKEKSKKVESDHIENHELFQALRVLRKKIADEQHVPPYIIFSDVTLQDMANILPQTTEEFATIKGVGKQKLSLYANIFLREIRNFSSKQ
jgi:ATP-dependent DNA helicase RecQ